MQIYIVRKLHFQASFCEVFAEDKNSTIVETSL